MKASPVCTYATAHIGMALYLADQMAFIVLSVDQHAHYRLRETKEFMYIVETCPTGVTARLAFRAIGWYQTVSTDARVSS